MKKKVLSMLVTIAMLFSMLPATALAAEEWNGTNADTSWYNDSDTEFTIDSADKLAGLAKLVNEGKTFTGKIIKLGNNIDLAGKEWTPIGAATYTDAYAPAEGAHVFCGEFDGNGKTISNLKITKLIAGSKPNDDANIGLFSITGQGAVIKDLTITNVDIFTTGRNVGALAGFAYNATLDNITINGNINISGGHNVAGVCGLTRHHDMSATNITVSGDAGSVIKGKNIVGGIITEIAPNGSNQTFRNLSVENVEIKGEGGVGGIVGLLTDGSMSNVSVKNVALTGNTEFQGNSMGRIRMGSVVGLLGSNGPSTVSGVTVEDVTGKNLSGETVTLPVVGANYSGDIGNATEAKIGDDYYATLKIALSKANSGDTITLLADVNTTESIKISGKLTIDLNGHTLTGTDSATGNFGLIDMQLGSDLTINDTVGTGKITLEATNNREWNAYSSVISNQRGKLTVNGGTIEHLGGTDMAYGIDNLTNGPGTYAETIVNGGTVKSTYRAIRQFLNGTEAQNILTVNGGTIEGVNKSIWMQDPSKKANSGTLTVSNEAALVGNVYLYVTSGSTEWPVSVSIANDAFADGYTVMTANVPKGTKVDVVGGYWGISDASTSYVAAIKGVSYTSLQDAINAAKPGDTVTLLADCAENVTVAQAEGVKITIDGNRKTMTGSITVDGKSQRYDTAALTIKNVNFDAVGISADACINLGVRGNSNTRYTNHVTVQDCTFTYSGASNQDKVAVKSYTGGDKNLQVIRCTADNTMHSLLQVTNVEEGLVVDSCTVKSKSGINLNSTAGAEIKNSTIEVSGYAVRIGAGSGGSSGKITLTNNVLKTNNTEGYAAVVIRGEAVTKVDLAMTRNAVSGNTHISGTVAETKISANANYWDGKAAPVVSGTAVEVTNYYSDMARTNLVTPGGGSSGGGGGGSSSSGDYQVTVDSVKNGKVTVSPSRADKGDTVTITVKPNDGYQLDKLTVTDKNGNTVKLTSKGSNKYTFTMPVSKVTVEASFAKTSSSPVDSFLDVNTGAWYYDAVKYAVENGLMSGTGTYTFEPNTTLSRGMIAQMLYALEGKPSVSSASNFTDVSSSDWYDKAASWAQSKGIITGYEDGRFGPNDPLTREQLALILYNYAKSEGHSTSTKADLSKFADDTSTSPWAQQAMSWAVGEGLLSGRGVNMLYPTGTATRAEVAQIMMNFCENVAK